MNVGRSLSTVLFTSFFHFCLIYFTKGWLSWGGCSQGCGLCVCVCVCVCACVCVCHKPLFVCWTYVHYGPHMRISVTIFTQTHTHTHASSHRHSDPGALSGGGSSRRGWERRLMICSSTHSSRQCHRLHRTGGGGSEVKPSLGTENEYMLLHW
jgi:hypothetical protein